MPGEAGLAWAEWASSPGAQERPPPPPFLGWYMQKRLTHTPIPACFCHILAPLLADPMQPRVWSLHDLVAHFAPAVLSHQECEGVSCHYWSLFDGHAGSGAAVVASRLLQHHVTEQLQDLVEILKNSAVLPPTCLGEEPETAPAPSRTLTRAASLRGGVGAPGSPSAPPTRFFTEKKIPHECLVIGALESAFKEMVSSSHNPLFLGRSQKAHRAPFCKGAGIHRKEAAARKPWPWQRRRRWRGGLVPCAIDLVQARLLVASSSAGATPPD